MRAIVTTGPSISVTLSVLVNVYVVIVGLRVLSRPLPDPDPVSKPEDGMEPNAVPTPEADPDPNTKLTESADWSTRNVILSVLTSTVSLNVRMRSSEVKLRL